MSDDLRELIADVIRGHALNLARGPDCVCGWEWWGDDLFHNSYSDHLADALINAGVSQRPPDTERNDQ